MAGGRSTNFLVNAPNAGNRTTIVIADIRFGQAIWWLKTHFPTVEEELRNMIYGTITKGDITIDELYRKIVQIGKQANLVAVNGRTAVQIGADSLNETLGQPRNAIVKLRAVKDPWNED